MPIESTINLGAFRGDKATDHPKVKCRALRAPASPGRSSIIDNRSGHDHDGSESDSDGKRSINEQGRDPD